GLSGQGPVLAHRREVRDHDPLHGADRDPDVHEMGRGIPAALRSLEPQAARVRRRADQPRGVGLVLEGDRRWTVPRRRHVVADGDRSHPDHAATGDHRAQARLGYHKSVAKAAVIGKPHEIKGQAIAAFVTLKQGVESTPGLQDELKQHVAKKIGALARPDDVIFAAELPKTRSGKIMRRLLRDIAEGRALGDTTTLADPAVVASLKTKYEDQEG